MRGRILFIDDEPEILKAVKFYLEDEDFEVYVAEEGNAALELAESVRPDLIILDVMMPAMDGFQVCRQLRARTRTRLIPIIFLTARGGVEDKVLGLEAGGIDYVTKPFNNQELLARVKAHIRHSQEEAASHPVTRLPGGPSVEEEVNRNLQEEGTFTTVFVAIDHFRAYREAYGVSRSERVLQSVARLLENAVYSPEDGLSFLGQPAYEEFLFICSPERADETCAGIIADFEERKPSFYLEQHRQREELTYYDYHGELVRSPFMNLIMGGVCNSRRFVASYPALAEWGAQALLKAHSRGCSAYIIEE